MLANDKKEAVITKGSPPDEDSRRSNKRRSVLWPATLHVGGHEFDCHIWNFSMGGLKLKLNLPLKEGAVIKVEIPKRNTLLSAEVSWQEADYLGIRFQEKEDVLERAFGERARELGLAQQANNRDQSKRVA